MPASIRFPGVSLKEIPGRAHTITGVATSITAFIGRASRGPVNLATAVRSFSEYETVFGGLDTDSAMSFAVRDFFVNGGRQAVIGRLFRVVPGKASTAVIAVDNLTLNAIYPGSWANYLRVRVDYNISLTGLDSTGPEKSHLFNLTVRDTKTGVTERYENVSVLDGPRRLDTVLRRESKLVEVSGDLPQSRPLENEQAESSRDSFDSQRPGTYYNATSFAGDGAELQLDDYIGRGKENAKEGLYLLDQLNLFNLLCLPPENQARQQPTELLNSAIAYCEKKKALLLVDAPAEWQDLASVLAGVRDLATPSINAALFYPRLNQTNPLNNNQIEAFVPCGAVAGVISRTDARKGVWKAPAGRDATLLGVVGLSVNTQTWDVNELSVAGVSCFTHLPDRAPMVWGSRTLVENGYDNEYKYLSVRRFALFIEESLLRGTRWVVFECNGESLWSQLQHNVTTFMEQLFKQGAIQGNSSQEAYYVKCDRETMTQSDIDQGIVNIVVGFAPLKPAEFVILNIQQTTRNLNKLGSF